MIAHLKGSVLFWAEQLLVVDVNGVGYEVHSPTSTTLAAPEGADVALHIHMVVREDAMQLYGFITQQERALFLLLIGVSGVGPKVAMAVLSTLAPEALSGAIMRGDVAALSQVPGVGKKTASRLALELKDKVAQIAPSAEPATMMATAGAASSPHRDALSALLNLGYPKARAEAALAGLADGPEQSVEALIRHALTQLGAGS